MLCPECRLPLDEMGEEAPVSQRPLACANGHLFTYQDGVLVLLAQGFRQRLQTFTAALEPVRQAQAKRLLDEALYPQLPFITPDSEAWEWRLRRYDLALIWRWLAGRAGLRILDVGAWNGWLSNRLAEDGHRVTAVDYFTDPHDGLGARRFYRSHWRAIQMDLADLSILDPGYDLIVLNRCLAFFTEPVAYVTAAQPLLAPGGRLVLTGLQIFHKPAVKARQVTAYRRAHLEQYGFELFLRPSKGYLDQADAAGLQAAGVSLRPYRELWPANLKAWLWPTRPFHQYGIYERRGDRSLPA
jgi:2-polyprenyl-3-methyl-5-hydroxy-6-metoxy-1,4-benzoquinol methylase